MENENKKRKLNDETLSVTVKKAKNDVSGMSFGLDVLEPLDWKLKEEKDRKEGKGISVTEDPQVRAQKVMEELHKLKQQREERVLEKQRMEDERHKAQKMTDIDASYNLADDAFYLQQTRIKAQKRISEGRGSPLDALYCVVHFAPDFPSEATVPPPSKVCDPNVVDHPKISTYTSPPFILLPVTLWFS
eukprot:TRINITY_DN3776_c0_g2_i5.p1 TRINITY_DN3776_c0_g2~~TRINITY_DN3776_c0_g2_i5.p1  ORF type:complete len:198 (+),score=53.87 TRINITY_DN3776_c0_g2_i5:30-596(+)